MVHHMVEENALEKQGDSLSSARDGGVYLLVLDDSPGFDAALRRVSYLARQNNGHVAFLHVSDSDNYLHWNFIEKKIQSDQRAQIEKMLWDAGQRLYEMCGLIPSFYVREGDTRQQVLDILTTDTTIRALVLGVSKNNALISYLTGRGLSDLTVPLVIVPENY